LSTPAKLSQIIVQLLRGHNFDESHFTLRPCRAPMMAPCHCPRAFLSKAPYIRMNSNHHFPYLMHHKALPDDDHLDRGGFWNNVAFQDCTVAVHASRYLQEKQTRAFKSLSHSRLPRVQDVQCFLHCAHQRVGLACPCSCLWRTLFLLNLRRSEPTRNTQATCNTQAGNRQAGRLAAGKKGQETVTVILDKV